MIFTPGSINFCFRGAIAGSYNKSIGLQVSSKNYNVK